MATPDEGREQQNEGRFRQSDIQTPAQPRDISLFAFGEFYDKYKKKEATLPEARYPQNINIQKYRGQRMYE